MDRCALCPRVNKCLPPDGPVNSDILFIGESPNAQEEKANKIFGGKTGDEVNRHYLPLAGLSRNTVRFTNAIRCLPISVGGKLDPSRDKDTALLESCVSQFLYPEIERGRWRVLVPLGSFACRAVFGEAFDLELRHGIPTPTPWGILAFPMYHPALGIHEPKKMLYIRTDWQRFRQYLSGRLVTPRDAYAGQEDYQEITDVDTLELELDPTLPLAADTETRRGGAPHCFTFSQSAGMGRLIRASRQDLLLALQSSLARWESSILFHNYLYDWSVVHQLGLRIPHHRIVDTMARVFHLGNLPQGLKALAQRELGMEMQDFEDLVKPYSRERVITYFEAAADEDWPRPPERIYLDDKTGLWKLKKPQGMNTKFKRFHTDLRKYGEAKDVFKSWDNWEEDQAMIEERMGPYPGMCITHAPEDQVLFYACRDADALIRLWEVIKHMRARVRHTTQEHWRE